MKATHDSVLVTDTQMLAPKCYPRMFLQLCRTDAQAAVIARSLGPSVVKLSLDPNGNHVVQRALQHMPAPRNDFVLEAITSSLVQVRYDMPQSSPGGVGLFFFELVRM